MNIKIPFRIVSGIVLIKKDIRFLLLFTFFFLDSFSAFSQQVRPKWVDNLMESGSANYVTNMALDKENNIYITGQFTGTIDADPSPGIKNLTSAGAGDIFIGKYKQDGTLIWAESIGGTGNDQPYGLAVDKDGNVSLVGQFASDTLDADPGTGVYNLYNPNNSDNNTSGFLIHLDTNGAFLWASSLGVLGIHLATDSQDDVIATYFWGGSTTIGDSTYSASGSSGLIVKYSANGNVIWSIFPKDNQTSSEYNYVTAYDIRVDSQDNILISGGFNYTANFNPLGTPHFITSPGINTSYFLAKYSSSGILSWVNNINVSGSGYPEGLFASSICLDQKDNIYFSSQLADTLNFGTAILTPIANNPGQCLAKYNSSGALQFAKSITPGSGASIKTYIGIVGLSGSWVNVLATDQNNNIYLTGQFGGTVNFNLNSGTPDNLTSHGAGDFFVAKYDFNGNYLHAFNCGPPNNIYIGGGATGSCIVVDNNNNINIGGIFGPAMSFDPTGCSTDTATATASDRFEGFFAQYGAITVSNNVIDAPMVSSFCTNGTPTAITGSLPTGGSGAYKYQWLSSADSVTFADINSATAQNYTPSTLTATTYYERMVSSDTCTVPTVSNIVGLHVLPTLAASVVTVAATTSSSIIFTWTAVTGATSYQISTNGGQSYTTVSGIADTIRNLQPGQSITISVQAAGIIPCQISAVANATGNVPASDVVFVANAFTPNGDGRDDILHVKGENIQSLKFYIYDQWGELIFSTTSQQNGWDGTYKGTKEPVGVYVYYLEAVMNDGTSVKKKGTVTLLK